jgi:hypothetical protein
MIYGVSNSAVPDHGTTASREMTSRERRKYGGEGGIRTPVTLLG